MKGMTAELLLKCFRELEYDSSDEVLVDVGGKVYPILGVGLVQDGIILDCNKKIDGKKYKFSKVLKKNVLGVGAMEFILKSVEGKPSKKVYELGRRLR